MEQSVGLFRRTGSCAGGKTDAAGVWGQVGRPCTGLQNSKRFCSDCLRGNIGWRDRLAAAYPNVLKRQFDYGLCEQGNRRNRAIPEWIAKMRNICRRPSDTSKLWELGMLATGGANQNNSWTILGMPGRQSIWRRDSAQGIRKALENSGEVVCGDVQHRRFHFWRNGVPTIGWMKMSSGQLQPKNWWWGPRIHAEHVGRGKMGGYDIPPRRWKASKDHTTQLAADCLTNETRSKTR